MTDISKLPSKFKKVQGVISDFTSRGLDKNSFCSVPFTTIILEPNGSVGICRLKGTEESIGNIKDNNLMDIWNGEKARRWRREFLDGRPKICKNDVAYRNCNLCAETNTLLKDAQLTEIQTSPILKFTANFNGKCNLECQMCTIWQMPNGLYDEINFWEPAKKEIFPHLKEIDMLSGEPFIQKDTYRLIDEVSLVNNDCLWTITTNAHWKLNKRIEDYLNKIEFKALIISIDSLIPETYAKIRKLGNLETVLSNVDKILEYQKKRIENKKGSLNINVNMLIQKDNWKEIPSLLKYCSEKNIDPHITFCYRPEKHSLLDLDNTAKKEILDYYFLHFSDMDLYRSMRVIKPLVFSMDKIDKFHYLLEIKRVTENVEKQVALL
jgi:cyclic pyranopterin phosphate synthase